MALVLRSLTTTAGIDWGLSPASPEPLPIPLPANGIPATVPGEVHTALLDRGLITDPFDGDQEKALAWIGDTDWVWSAAFDWPDHKPFPEPVEGPSRHDLVLSGVDTVATISLNGTEVARTANQHRSYRFDVGRLLRGGRNELEIAIQAPYAAAEERSAALGARPHANQHPYNSLRKMASAYGWDWGPDLAGAGLLGEIGLESWTGARIAAVRPHPSWSDGVGRLALDVELDWAAPPPGAAPVTVLVECAGATTEALVPADTTAVRLDLRPVGVAAWWPRGYGDQPRYRSMVRLDDELVWERQIGFRTVTLGTAADAIGTEFLLAVNGRPVFVKGANWIPADALMSRLDAVGYRTAITDAYDAGMNLLRVWGGGIYEREEFYEVCDELGLLVWQDFLFACAAYSEGEPLAAEVEAEAREAITRLSAHPSLALWNGNNENIWGYVDWGWRAELAGATWGDGYYTELLPRLVAELAPGTPYSPASPFSFAPYHHPNDPNHGTMHIWDVWNTRDYRTYADYRPRFVSEFGFQGPPAWSTLTSVVHDEPLDPYGPQMLVHQKAMEGNLKLERGLGSHLPHWTAADGTADLDDWHWLTQLNQARAVAFGINHFRSLFPINRGSIVWQLNDNWPVISWAAVDASGIRKPLWHVLRRTYADRYVAVPGGPDLDEVVLHNDTDIDWVAELVARRHGTGPGSPLLAEQRRPVQVPPRSVVRVPLETNLRTAVDPAAELLVVEASDAPRSYGYFVEDTELALAAVDGAYLASARQDGDAVLVTVQADSLVKDLTLFPDRVDPAARVDTALVTLLAGETHTFTVTGLGDLDRAALTTRPVLRSVNDLQR